MTDIQCGYRRNNKLRTLTVSSTVTSEHGVKYVMKEGGQSRHADVMYFLVSSFSRRGSEVKYGLGKDEVTVNYGEDLDAAVKMEEKYLQWKLSNMGSQSRHVDLHVDSASLSDNVIPEDGTKKKKHKTHKKLQKKVETDDLDSKIGPDLDSQQDDEGSDDASTDVSNIRTDSFSVRLFDEEQSEYLSNTVDESGNLGADRAVNSALDFTGSGILSSTLSPLAAPCLPCRTMASKLREVTHEKSELVLRHTCELRVKDQQLIDQQQTIETLKSCIITLMSQGGGLMTAPPSTTMPTPSSRVDDDDARRFNDTMSSLGWNGRSFEESAQRLNLTGCKQGQVRHIIKNMQHKSSEKKTGKKK